jgi:hypothetical protein
VTKGGPLVPGLTVVNTTRDKRSGVLYKPRRLPDWHLAVFPQITTSPLFLHRRRRRLSSPRLSPTRGSSPTRRPSPTRAPPRCVAPPRHARIAVSRRRRARSLRRPPLTDADLRDAVHLPRRGAPPRRVPQPPSSAAAPSPPPQRCLSSIPAAGMPRRCRLPAPLCGRRPACVCPDCRPGRAGVWPC